MHPVLSHTALARSFLRFSPSLSRHNTGHEYRDEYAREHAHHEQHLLAIQVRPPGTVYAFQAV